MRVTFADTDLKELIERGSNGGRYKRLSRDSKFTERLVAIYHIMCAVNAVNELKNYSFLHYERLRHIQTSSVRVMNGRVERLLFYEMSGGIEIELIELNESHYGNKR